MAINLRVTLGTVNYTDWLHVTASKVSDPSTINWQTWIDVPVSNYNFIIPDLDASIYYIRYYDALTNVALGTLVAELVVNALTGETISERRFYTVDGVGVNDPSAGDTSITDTYLIGKTVSGVFKESFRYLKPTDEYIFTDAIGEVDVINGTIFETGEIFIVEITYTIGSTSNPTNGGLYNDTMTITAQAQTLVSGDAGKRIRLNGSTLTQVITLATLASIATDTGFYFDHGVGGVPYQVKILTQGADRIFFSGFASSSDLFSEFWVGMGEKLLIRKYGSYYEVITDYRGTNVGERVANGYNAHVSTLPEDGRLVDGDEYPRLWWWLNNVLPATHKHVPTTQSVTDVGFSFATADVMTRTGQFMMHATLKKFRMPNTQLLSERAIKTFAGGGVVDVNRTVDYAGGNQDEMVGQHNHIIQLRENGTGNSSGYPAVTDNNAIPKGTAITNNNIATENRVKNFGVIYARRV